MPFFHLLIPLLLGIGIGIITGIVPGIHVNLVSAIVVTSSALLLRFTSPLGLGIFIISLAITHTFLDNIPGIYLGAPDPGQELNVLPGHRLLHRGEGHNALIYTLIGSLGSLLLGIILLPLFIVIMKVLASPVQAIIGYLLILIMIYMILKEKGKRLRCLAAFLLSGSLGLLVFRIPTLQQPLFPLLSGLFGISLLLVSLFERSTIPPQDLKKPLTMTPKNMIKAVSAASGVGFIAAFLPGFGSSQAAIVATNTVGDLGDEGFLTLVGGINTANMLISIGTAYALDKARNGAIVAVNEIMGGIGFEEMLIFLAVALIAGGAATLLSLGISRQFAAIVPKIPYAKLVIGIILFIIILSFIFDGLLGLLVLLTATALGLVASSWKIGKNHLMGCLIVPVILYFVL